MSALETKVTPQRVVRELRELAALTDDGRGAQRLCWTETWAVARAWFDEKLAALPLERSVDAAGNLWATLPGRSPTSVVIGSHLDSVPNGGWLDGALGVLSGLEVLRALASCGPPPVTVKLVDWADEEGARFGYGLWGSSAASGTLDVEHASGLTDRDGRPLPEVLADHGVDLRRIGETQASLQGVSAYVELHIEQGPVLEQLGLPLGVVLGTKGVEREVIRFVGQAAHAGSTPMAERRDALAAAARLILAVRELALAADAVATVGRCAVTPGIATAVAGVAEVTLDQRHLDRTALAELARLYHARAEEIAREEGVEVEWRPLWSIEPIAFSPDLIEIATETVQEVSGSVHQMASGPLHDAAEVSRAGVPTVMLFVQSLNGISHAQEEDTREEHLELAVRALAATVERIIHRQVMP